ncbi:amidase [Thozetella sp. PMI_491]|nr:amidase [Thozetella sp. PMI_491]
MTPQTLSSTTNTQWEVKAAEKRARCRQALPEAWLLPPSFLETLPNIATLHKLKIDLMSLDIPRHSGIMTEREIQITESYTLSALLENLASGKLTSLEVTLAFSKRATIAQQLVTQERARELDSLRESGKLAGPLHGLPISLKDTYQVEGTQAIVGAAAYLDFTSEENSALVEILLGLGAVLYVKTNVSQLQMSTDSDNNVFGRVLNPRNTMLSAGGSSGGEGALLAVRGSPLGVATDLAGSIRIPSLCCGTYGFKPSSGRVPFGRQQIAINLGLNTVMPSAGPIANDMEALSIFMKTVIGTRPFRHDATAIDVPWRATSIAHGRKLRVGLLVDDPLFPLHPPVTEAVMKAAQTLQSKGHEVVTLDATECHVAAATEVALGIFSLDKAVGEVIASTGEPFVPSIRAIVKERANIDWKLLPKLASMGELQKFLLLQTKREEIAEAWRKLWIEQELDAVIAPSAQTTAVEHDHFGWAPYTAFLNVLDYPACVIPLGKARVCTQEFTKNPGQSVAAYNAEAIEGAPCSIQIFTSRMRDEECLAAAEIIDACLDGLRTEAADVVKSSL